MKRAIRNNFIYVIIAGVLSSVVCALYAQKYSWVNLLTLGFRNPLTFCGFLCLASVCTHWCLKIFDEKRSLGDVTAALGLGSAAFIGYELYSLAAFFLPVLRPWTGIAFTVAFFIAVGVVWKRLGFTVGFCAFFACAMLNVLGIYGGAFMSRIPLSPAFRYVYTYFYRLDCAMYVVAACVGVIIYMCAAPATSRKRMAAAICALAVASVYVTVARKYSCLDKIISGSVESRMKLKESAADRLLDLPTAVVSRDWGTVVFDPKEDYTARMYAGNMYFAGKADEKALLSYNICMKLADGRERSAEAARMISHVLRISGDYDGAEKYAAKAVKLAPKNPDCRVALALVQLALGKEDEALKSADDMALRQLESESWIPWAICARIYGARGDKKQEEASLIMLKSKNPTADISDTSKLTSQIAREDLIKQ